MQAIKTNLTHRKTKRSPTSPSKQMLNHSKFPYSNPTKEVLRTKVSDVDGSGPFLTNCKCLNKQTTS